MAALKRLKRGFTLVELMIVVAIIGILAALAIYGVSRYMTTSKTAEARMMLGTIAKSAVSAYDHEHMSGELLAAGATAATSHRLCDSSSAVPTDMTKIKGAKYQSTAAEWEAGASETVGWRCLKFSIVGPQYFQYKYTSNSTNSFTALAHGDLNGNGTASTFKLLGAVRDESGKKIATYSPNFIEDKPNE